MKEFGPRPGPAEREERRLKQMYDKRARDLPRLEVRQEVVVQDPVTKRWMGKGHGD